MPLSTGLPGIPVRTYTVVGGTGEGQLVGFAQPKDCYRLVTRTGVTAPDFAGPVYDPTAVAPLAVADAAWLWVCGHSSVAGSAISFVPVYYESGGAIMNVGDPLQLIAANAYAVGGRYLAVGAPVYLDVLAAASVGIVVLGVTGSWTLGLKPF